MKTERMTLLISPADKAAITARAEGLGLSVSELMRTAALDFDPEIDDKQAQLEALLGEIEAALDRIDANIDMMGVEAKAHSAEMLRLASPEYREQVRREVLADPSINWAAMGTFLGGFRHREAKAA
jgi:hypothetical protein